MLQCLLWIALDGADARASEPGSPVPRPEAAPDLMLVISGGISRGAYQAGQMYALSSWLRGLGDEGLRQQFDGATGVTVAGSSAGSVNAVLTALELETQGSIAAGEPWDLPEASLHFRTWIPLGFDSSDSSLDSSWYDQPRDHQALINDALVDLLVGRAVSEVAARPPGGVFERGTRLVMTATRSQPRRQVEGVVSEVTVSFGFQIDDLDQVRVLRHACPESVRASQKVCSPAQQWSIAEPGSEQRAPLAEVSRLAVASSSIPGAFRLFYLPCDDFDAWSPGPTLACGAASGEDGVWLLDGGAFEGNPVRVSRAFAWREPHEPEGSRHPRFLFMDPDLVFEIPRTPKHVDTMYERYMQLLGLKGAGSGVVAAARNQSVSLYLQDNPDALDNASLLYTATAPYGNYLGGLMAFYDRAFRVFDFYAGLLDVLTWLQGQGYGDLASRIPGDSLFASVARCLRGAERGEADACRSWETLASDPAAAGLRATVQRINSLRLPQRDGAPPLPVLSDAQLWNNLMVLAALHGQQARALRQGEPWTLDDLAEHLDLGVPPLGPFQPQDLGEDSFAAEVRERVGWQVGRIYERDIVSNKVLMALGLTGLRQALTGDGSHFDFALATPLRQDALGAANLGAGWALRPTQRWSWPADLIATLEVPSREFRSDAAGESWGVAAALELSTGPRVGLWRGRNGSPHTVLGPRYIISASPRGFVQGYAVATGALAPELRFPPLVERQGAPASGLAIGGALRLEFAELAYLTTSIYPHFVEDGGRDLSWAFSLGWMFPLHSPFGSSEDAGHK